MQNAGTHTYKDQPNPKKRRTYSFSDKENYDANFRIKVNSGKATFKHKPMTCQSEFILKNLENIEEKNIAVIKEDPRELETENKEFVDLVQSERNDSQNNFSDPNPTATVSSLEEKKEKSNKKNKKKSYDFKPFHLLTEIRSKERKTQSFYTPAPSKRYESKKNLSIDQGGFTLQTETRGVKKKLEFDLELKKNEEIEKINRLFKAQPIPNYQEMRNEFLNKHIETPKITKPIPIHFKTDERALKSFYKPEIPKEEPPQLFKAKEVPDFSKLFFELKRFSPKKSIDHSEFKLLTAERAQKRNEYESVMKERLIYAEKQQIESRKQKEDEEKKELDSLRKELIFKAQPVRRFKLINVESSQKKLTSPKEFKFNETVSKCKLDN